MHRFHRNPTFCGDAVLEPSEVRMKRADGRPRVHLWPEGRAWTFSYSPTGVRLPASSAGAAVDAALHGLDKHARKGAVIIVEPRL